MATNDVCADSIALLHRLNQISQRLHNIFSTVRNLPVHNFSIIPLLREFHRLVREFSGLLDRDSFHGQIDTVNSSFRDLTQLIRQLVEEARECMVRGSPADKEAVEALLKLTIAGYFVNEESHCSNCTEAFESGKDALQMPCHQSHIFYSHCLLPWLERRNTCPICRALLVTPRISRSVSGFPVGSEDC
ncbi:hypothetical protein SUGI_1513650 [Cryptomeria japonica]|uniref:RING-type domain-containing protein n=1 Tax=Cryptomeria japonica TaxID=3369 RepID=A0AAD3NW57_CRYJA|nr:E3 ubiquitin-protein ligase RDUF1-like [Cryptomeria japonica]XP_059072195.1 E3 ubiquitin-protein ligase RDUF1-like [Cryptomeria japonica]XP_059072265.1 E3 ubiquitin-protein ligase RDUF1-like [Cryptomeria japonica]XP_059072267.1 E3 ubiquitin-protein ligase RDUF1-like [Cryptomeria japonica]GLJ59547.1 hypothetical protein SUGI_1513650 [Cryptomeria japonica]